MSAGPAYGGRVALPMYEVPEPGPRFTEPPPAGTPVWVMAFGAYWRAGTVTKVLRTRVEVDYAANQTGRRDVRPFGLAVVRRRFTGDEASS